MIAPCSSFSTISGPIPFPSSSFSKTLIRSSTCYSLLHNSVEIQDKTQQVLLHSCRNSPPIEQDSFHKAPTVGWTCPLAHTSAALTLSSTATSFAGWPLGPPPGLWILPGDRNSTGPGSGEPCSHPQKGKVAGARTPAQKVPIISLSSLYCGTFSVTLFQGTLIFARTLVSSLWDGKHL